MNRKKKVNKRKPLQRIHLEISNLTETLKSIWTVYTCIFFKINIQQNCKLIQIKI